MQSRGPDSVLIDTCPLREHTVAVPIWATAIGVADSPFPTMAGGRWPSVAKGVRNCGDAVSKIRTLLRNWRLSLAPCTHSWLPQARRTTRQGRWGHHSLACLPVLDRPLLQAVAPLLVRRAFLSASLSSSPAGVFLCSAPAIFASCVVILFRATWRTLNPSLV